MVTAAAAAISLAGLTPDPRPMPQIMGNTCQVPPGTALRDGTAPPARPTTESAGAVGPAIVLQRPQHLCSVHRVPVTVIAVDARGTLIAQLLPHAGQPPHPLQLTPRSLHHPPRIP